MASKLLSTLVAGSLVFSSSFAAAQVAEAPLAPAAETSLGANGESRLRGGDPDATMAIIFGLIVFAIAIWIGRDDDEEDIGTPVSP